MTFMGSRQFAFVGFFVDQTILENVLQLHSYKDTYINIIY